MSRSISRRAVLAGLPVLIVFAAAALLLVQHRADGITCDRTFVGAAHDAWNVDANWSPASVPTATETACSSVVIDAPGSIEALAVDLDGGLELASGTLHLASATETSSITGLGGASPSLTVDGPLELTASNTVLNVTGVGTVDVLAGATLTVSNVSTIGAGGLPTVVTNHGTLHFGGGTVTLDNSGATIANHATFEFAGDGEIAGNGTMTNDGTIESTATTAVFSIPLDNDGTVNIAARLELLNGSGVDSSGQYTTSSGSASLHLFGGGAFSVSGATPFTGPGTLVVEDGSTLDGVAPGSVTNLAVQDGTLSGDTTITGSLQLGTGSFLDQPRLFGAGATTVASTATFTINSNLDVDLSGGHHLVNQSSLSFGQKHLSICGLSTQFVNEGTLNLDGAPSSGTPVACVLGGDPGRLVNTATGTITATVGGDYELHSSLDNAGTITVDGSLLVWDGTNTGTVSVANPSDVFTVQGPTATATFSGTAAVTGDGLFVANGVDWQSSGSMKRVRVGNMSGSPTITGDLDLEGNLAGPGTATIAAGATATLDSTSVVMRLEAGVNLVNNGTITQTEFLGMCGASTLTNNGTWNAQDRVDLVVPSFPVCTGGNSVTNSATGVVTLTGNFRVVPSFTNVGTLDVGSATATLSGGSNSGPVPGSGQLVVANDSSTFDIGTSTITGPAVTVAGGGTLTSAAGASVRSLLLDITASSSGTLTVTEQLKSDSGDLRGSGTTTLASTAVLVIDDGFSDLDLHDTHQLVIDGAVVLDTADFLPLPIGACDSSKITVNGSLSIGYGIIDDCGGSSASVDIGATGTLRGIIPGAGFAVPDLLVPLHNDGLITVDSSSSLDLAAITNNGRLVVGSFAQVETTGLTNIVGNTLTSGTYDLDGPLRIDGAPDLLTNQADLTLRPNGQITDELFNSRMRVRNNALGAHLRLEVFHSVPIFINSGRVELTNSLFASSGYLQSAGTTVLEGGTINKAQFIGGRVEGSGFLGNPARLFNATIAPSTPGSSTIGALTAGTFSMTSASTAEIDLDDSCACPASDTIDVSTGALAGTLALSGQGPPGSTTTVINSSGLSGGFGTITGTFVPPATNLIVTQDAGSVQVLTSPPPEVSIGAPTISEGTGGTTTVTAEVHLSWPSANPISVDVTTADGSATAPSDYASLTETVTFLPGETLRLVNIDVVADNAFEGDEDFTVNLSNVVGSATITTASATVTVQNDDQLGPTVFTDGVDTNPGDGACDDGSGQCTLRAAIQEANALPGQQTIFLPFGTYTLSTAGTDEDAAASGDLDITEDLILHGGSSTVDAGAIDRAFDVRSGSVQIDNLTITNGAASVVGSDPGHGGGMLLRAGSTPDLQSLQFTTNSAERGGGGLATLTSFTGSSVSFSNNTAGDGGGFYSINGAVVELNSSTFSNNTATGFGGGMAAGFGGSVSLDNSTVTGNQAPSGGGLAAIAGTTLNFDQGSINNNTASTQGAGVLMSDADAHVSSSNIQDNSSPGAGGGLLLAQGTSTVADSRFAGNSGNVGGGIVTAFGTTTVTGSTFSGNSATFFGGAIASASNLTVQNSTITGNSGPFGAGLANYHDNTTPAHGVAVLHSVTFGANTGPAIANFTGADTTVTNSIFASAVGGGPTCTGGTPVVSGDYNVTADTTCGFAQPNDFVGDVDLGALQFNGGSTPTQLPAFWAIDTSNACLATDQRGVARPSGFACDRGAVEQ